MSHVPCPLLTVNEFGTPVTCAKLGRCAAATVRQSRWPGETLVTPHQNGRLACDRLLAAQLPGRLATLDPSSDEAMTLRETLQASSKRLAESAPLGAGFYQVAHDLTVTLTLPGTEAARAAAKRLADTTPRAPLPAPPAVPSERYVPKREVVKVTGSDEQVRFLLLPVHHSHKT